MSEDDLKADVTTAEYHRLRAGELRKHSNENKVTLGGGGTRSAGCPPYHLVPLDGLERTAKRFALGAEKHGAFNWLQSVQTRQDAFIWCQEALNHMQAHLSKLQKGDTSDDHLGAIGWAQSVIAYVEATYHCNWWELQYENGTPMREMIGMDVNWMAAGGKK